MEEGARLPSKVRRPGDPRCIFHQGWRALQDAPAHVIVESWLAYPEGQRPPVPTHRADVCQSIAEAVAAEKARGVRGDRGAPS